ncbi:hypothetical protein EPN42_10980 [bacterium]|nr:MAG: hypothetical protein EPN42_10980 [bacterium]
MAQQHAGLVIVGRMGAGKDYVVDRITAAIAQAHHAVSWHLGEHYYAMLGKRLHLSTGEIRRRKPEFRRALQTIGNDPFAQREAVRDTLERWEATSGIPVVIARRQEETEPLRAAGAAVLFIDADEETRRHRVLERDGAEPTLEMLNDASEPSIEAIRPDLVLDNGLGAGPLHVRFDRPGLQLVNGKCAVLVDLGLAIERIERQYRSLIVSGPAL